MNDRERLRAIRDYQARTGDNYAAAARAVDAAAMEAQQAILEAGRKAREGKEGRDDK
jgi:hypothetical protein